jgi:hypothetical protein
MAESSKARNPAEKAADRASTRVVIGFALLEAIAIAWAVILVLSRG